MTAKKITAKKLPVNSATLLDALSAMNNMFQHELSALHRMVLDRDARLEKAAEVRYASVINHVIEGLNLAKRGEERDDAFDAALKDLIEQLLERETQTRTFVAEIENQLTTQGRRVDKLVQLLTDAAKRGRPPEDIPAGWVNIREQSRKQAIMAGHIKGRCIDGMWYADLISLRAWERSRESALKFPVVDDHQPTKGE